MEAPHYRAQRRGDARSVSFHAGLKDDPFRSVAAFTRYAGGYHKSPQPFAEFRWANHLRHLVPFNGDPDSQEVGISLSGRLPPPVSLSS